MHKFRYLLISLDVVANTVADMHDEPILVQLYVFLLQDLSLLFSLLLILLQFFREDILRARLLGRMITAHWYLLAASFLYICLTVSWQAFHGLYWKKTFQSLRLAHCLAHRLVAVLYYFALAKPISLPTTSGQKQLP